MTLSGLALSDFLQFTLLWSDRLRVATGHLNGLGRAVGLRFRAHRCWNERR